MLAVVLVVLVVVPVLAWFVRFWLGVFRVWWRGLRGLGYLVGLVVGPVVRLGEDAWDWSLDWAARRDE